jgi:hypothetical protein
MSVLNQDLRILHWNCNGFDSAKKSGIFSFLSDQSAFIFCYLRHGNVISGMAEGAKKKLEDAYTITFLGS